MLEDGYYTKRELRELGITNTGELVLNRRFVYKCGNERYLIEHINKTRRRVLLSYHYYGNGKDEGD